MEAHLPLTLTVELTAMGMLAQTNGVYSVGAEEWSLVAARVIFEEYQSLLVRTE